VILFMPSKASTHTKLLTGWETPMKVCLIQRLTVEESIELFARDDKIISESTFRRLKAEYEAGTTLRIINIARKEWSEELILIIDIFKMIEQKYWQLYNEATSIGEATRILDSLRATQEQKAMFYNSTPLVAKMRETLEIKLNNLNKTVLKKLESRESA
jgi:predicted Zn-dependent protease